MGQYYISYSKKFRIIDIKYTRRVFEQGNASPRVPVRRELAPESWRIPFV